MLTLTRIESLLSTLPGLRIGLIGDLFLDRYLELAPGIRELSVETGLEAYQIPSVRNSPGALGTVMNNLAALGVGRLVPVTVIGDDGHGYDLRRALAALPVDLSHVVLDDNRLTPTYTKPLRQDERGSWQELNRLDIRTRGPLSPAILGRVVDQVRQVVATTDGVMVLDQVNEDDWGVVPGSLRELLAALHDEHPDRLMFIDSRRHVGQFSRGILKGNRSEILAAVRGPEGSEGDVCAALRQLTQRTGEPAFCTAGEQGTFVARPGGAPELVPGYPVAGPVDIVGAGDAASSGIVTALLAGCPVQDAAAFGNLVASITVRQLGTTGTASPAQVRARWSALHG